jgi:hypothetical protein
MVAVLGCSGERRIVMKIEVRKVEAVKATVRDA